MLTPTNELVKIYVDNFNLNNRINLSEKSIICLIDKFPDNKKIEEILLKVIAINTLYSTGILDTIKMAEWILACDIDSDIKNGKEDLVNKIAVGHGIKSSNPKNKLDPSDLNFYSFSTKYCSWHNHDYYPIYDSFVKKLLVAYQKRDKFSNFKTLDLKSYSVFKKVIQDFISFYKLNFKLKEIDEFLWAYGKEVFPPSWTKKQH